MYYPVETWITPLTTVRRERLLPVRGQVLVQPGEVVGPADVVARCLLPGQVHVVDVSRELRVRRDRAAKLVRKAAGDNVQAGETLASAAGLLGRFKPGCRAPVDGQVMAVRGSLILIQAAATTFELRAHVAGQVTNVMPNLGAVISSSGSLIQGVWGVGGEAEGVLKVLVDTPQKPLRARSIDVSCHGTLVVGGRIIDQEALKQAAEANVRGVIAGSVQAEMRPFLASLPFPVMLTEGFGEQPMSQHIFSLLQANMGREAMLSADTKIRRDTRRPELLIPLRMEEDRPPEQSTPQPLQVGAQVRILRGPAVESIGAVNDLPAFPQVVDSGLRLMVAVVDLEGGETLTVPLANLEAIR
jgi:hypothetical protein